MKYFVFAVSIFLIAVCLIAGFSSSPEPRVTTVAVDTVIPAMMSNQVPDTRTKIYSETLNVERTIALFGEVESNSVDYVISRILVMEAESTKPIYLLISSPGGSVFDGERLLSVMESSRAPVHTVCISLCASMAAIIHQYGVQRLALDRSVLMFHDASGGLSGEVKKMQSMLNLIAYKLERTDRYIAKRSGMSYEEFASLHKYDLWIEAIPAKKIGLVDKIISLKLPPKFVTATPTPNQLLGSSPENFYIKYLNR